MTYSMQFHVDYAGVRGELANSLDTTVRRVTLAYAAIDKLDDGEVVLEDVFAHFHFGSPPQSTPDTREELKRWVLTCGVCEAMEALELFTESIRFFAGIFSRLESGKIEIPASITTKEDLKESLRAREIKRFRRLPWGKRLDELRELFQFQTPFESMLLSIQALRNCLTHRQGKVTQYDANEGSSDTLRLQYEEIGIFYGKSEDDERRAGRDTLIEGGSSVYVKTVRAEKLFRIGTEITLTAQEFIYVAQTIWNIGISIVKELIAYGERAGVKSND